MMGILLVCPTLKVGSAQPPPKENWVPRNCVNDAGFAFMALVQSWGLAMLTPPMPPAAGIIVLCNSVPKDWAKVSVANPKQDANARRTKTRFMIRRTFSNDSQLI